MSRVHSERGEIRLRTLFESALLFLIAYVAVQVGPAVLLRLKFVDEMAVAANSPVEMSAETIKWKLIERAEGVGLTLLAEDVGVIRNQQARKTSITATYEIHINFWPSFTYVWLVRDRVEGFYY